MKILLLNQFFWPDAAATSQLLTDLAIHLAEQGHEVSAICAGSSYAVEVGTVAPPVTIYRTPAMPFKRGIAGRILSYASFYLGAAWRVLTLPSQDVVLTLTTPPLLSLIGTMTQFFRGSRHYIWEMDVYPDVATDLGTFKAGGLLDCLVGALADFTRRRADGIIALGECMKDRLVSRGLNPATIHVADNWADSQAIQPLPRPGDPSRLVLLYSGNLGLAHDVDTLAHAMLALRDDPRFRFVFVGSGGRTPELKSFCGTHALSAVEFRPYAQRSSLSESLAAGDIGLVTQRDACCGSVVPSKVYGLLAAGRPVLFIGPRAATPARIVERFGCGWQIDCGDTPALTSLLLFLANHPQEVVRASRNARRALLHHYDRPLGVARIRHVLEALPGASRPSSATHERADIFHEAERPSHLVAR